MNFIIHKHVGHEREGGHWTIEQRHVFSGPFIYCEMLAVVAQLLLRADHPRYPWEEKDGLPLAPIYSLRVVYVDSCYTIRRGQLFADGMCADEALGFIAAYTLTDGEKQFFGGMKNYEQWASKPWNSDREIAGLITYQPELVA